eukprot:10421421-Alexandrium_andersonii.AAC.1
MWVNQPDAPRQATAGAVTIGSVKSWATSLVGRPPSLARSMDAILAGPVQVAVGRGPNRSRSGRRLWAAESTR